MHSLRSAAHQSHLSRAVKPIKPLEILVLCTGNSARSLIGEALLNHYAAGKWHAYSADSHPKGVPHPMAIRTLQSHGIETKTLRSKSWDEFSTAQAPQLDVVITVCDNAANETCPLWHGTPIKVHWGIADPAAVTSSQSQQLIAFETAYEILKYRIERMSTLSLAIDHPSQLRAQLSALADPN